MARRRQQKRSRQRAPSAPAAPAAARPWALAAFLCGVFLVKLLILWQLRDHPLLQPEGGLDAAEYVRLAQRVIEGDVFLGPGLYYMSPLYIYFLAAALRISDSLTFVRLVQIALGTAAVGCVYASARAWFGRRAAWLAAVTAALTGVFTFYEIVLFQSSLDTFLTAAALALLSHRPDPRGPGLQRLLSGGPGPLRLLFRRPGPRGPGLQLAVAGSGLLFGLQILNRPNIVIAVAGMALVLLFGRQLRAAAWFAVGVAIALAPVVARNAIVSHQFALASSQGGLNLYIGNNAQATGQYAAVPGVRANIAGQSEDTRRVAEQATGRPLSDAEVSSYFSGLAARWMRQHPAAAARLFLKKLALVFNARHQWLDLSYPYYAHDVGSRLWLLFVGPWLLVPAGLAGLLAGAPRERRALYAAFASFAPLYAISVAVFFVAERYRLPLLIALCVSTGAALDALIGAIAARRAGAQPTAADVATRTSSKRTAIAAAAGIGAVAAFWPFDLPDGRFEERLRLSKILMNRRDYSGATLELQRAHALRPSDTVTEFNLGMALVSSGRADEGLAHVRHAVDAGVPIDGARYALASATLASGDRQGAVTLLRSYYPAPTDSADSCFQVGILALNAGAPRVAERYLQRALELRPGWPEAMRALEASRQ